MFKNQTGRKNFLLTQTMLAFAAIVSLSTVAQAQTTRCEGLFKDSNSKNVIRNESAEAFWLRSAQIAGPDVYSLALVEELGKSELEEPIYRQLIGPALWHYARLTVEAGPKDPVQSMLTGVFITIEGERGLRGGSQRDDHVRPKAMTADERRDAMAVGHYGLIEGSRLPRIRSDRQKMMDAVMEHARAGQQWYLENVAKNPAEPSVVEEFKRIQKSRRNEPPIAKADIDVMLESPVEYAIVYAQLTGLMGRSGTVGDLLSPFVPWTRPAANAEKFRVLSDLVSMGRAANASLADQRTADALVLEVLRHEFAPHLPVAP